jgi:hypothetical protein
VISLVANLLAASLLASPPPATITEGPRPQTDAIASPELAWQPAVTPPGGYWKFGERNVPEPPDGIDALTVGSVMFSLGLVRAGAGGISVYMATRPDLCGGDCASLRLFGWSGVGLGALMFVSGIVTFGVGAAQKAKHERWQRGEAKLKLAPWWTASHSTRSLGLMVDLRF